MSPQGRRQWGKYMTPEEFKTALHNFLRAQVAIKAQELKLVHAEPPQKQVKYSIKAHLTLGITPSPKHEGPLTPAALMESFDERYSLEHSPVTYIDEKYPRTEWLQMYIDKGYPLEDYNDYIESMNLRAYVDHIKKNPESWTSGSMGIPPTDDWETYKAAYIEERVSMFQRIRDTMDGDTEVNRRLHTNV